jgi:UDP-N-acetylmuramate dehydrogenase
MTFSSPPFTFGSSTTSLTLAGTACQIHPQYSLAALTSYRVGGDAEWFVAPKTRDELLACFEWVQQRDLPVMMLGAGSNLLISDHGIEGLVLSTRYLRDRNFDEKRGQITAAAGEPIAKIAWQAAKRGWRGMEWAVGIPGTVGGAVVMNAGAHQQCVADCLVSALVLTPEGQLQQYSSTDLVFSYRTSALQGQSVLVLEATFQLQPGFSKETVRADTTHNLNHRKSSQPYDKPSCGSVFRNPYPQAAGRLIEQLGLKGYRIGGAEVSHRHANFILNTGDAKATDIFNLIRYVQEQVEAHCALLLEPEVRILGEFSGS